MVSHYSLFETECSLFSLENYLKVARFCRHEKDRRGKPQAKDKVGHNCQRTSKICVEFQIFIMSFQFLLDLI